MFFGWLSAVRLVRKLVLVVLLVLLLPYALTLLYRAINPVSTLMVGRWLTGQTVSRTWTNLDKIASVVPRAVVGAEDAKFCSHRGIDWDSLQDAIEDAQGGEYGAGGSTITQQVAKNLFLWPGRSVIRKGLEFPLALWIDFVLPKRRVLEIYLNIAEWGPDGQFGVAEGASYAFGKGPRDLNAREAGLLAAILPNPVTRSALKPGPGVRRMAGTYAGRAQAVVATCFAGNREI